MMKATSTPGMVITMSKEEGHKLITDMYQWLGRPDSAYYNHPGLTLTVRLGNGEPNNCSISVGP